MKKRPDRAGDGRHARSGFCQVVRGLANMPSWPKCKLQMQNRWIPHFAIFGKYKNANPKMQNRWRCSQIDRLKTVLLVMIVTVACYILATPSYNIVVSALF